MTCVMWHVSQVSKGYLPVLRHLQMIFLSHLPLRYRPTKLLTGWCLFSLFQAQAGMQLSINKNWKTKSSCFTTHNRNLIYYWKLTKHWCIHKPCGTTSFCNVLKIQWQSDKTGYWLIHPVHIQSVCGHKTCTSEKYET